MADKFHSLVVEGSRHAIHNLTYPDAANRIAGTNEGKGIVLASTNLYQIAKQDDDNSLWMLTVVSPITWLAIGSDTLTTLDDAYNNGPTGDHIVEVDDGQVIWRLEDTESFRVDTGEAGAPIVVTDSDFELTDMSAWVNVSGTNVKDAVEQRSGLRCCLLGGSISQPTVFTIGVETTFGIWAKANTGSQALGVRTTNESIISEILPNDDTYHYYEATFTPTATNLIISFSAG